MEKGPMTEADARPNPESAGVEQIAGKLAQTLRKKHQTRQPLRGNLRVL
jgi:hypothetical protein